MPQLQTTAKDKATPFSTLPNISLPIDKSTTKPDIVVPPTKSKSHISKIAKVRHLLIKKEEPQNTKLTNDAQTVQWGAIVGFVCGILSLFVSALIFGLLAIIFSGIALGAISKNSDRYAGRGLAIAGLVLGIIALAVVILLIGAMV